VGISLEFENRCATEWNVTHYLLRVATNSCASPAIEIISYNENVETERISDNDPA
jgi:hypothetical protein